MLKSIYIKNIDNGQKIDVKAKDFTSAVNQVKIFDKNINYKYIEINEKNFLKEEV